MPRTACGSAAAALRLAAQHEATAAHGVDRQVMHAGGQQPLAQPVDVDVDAARAQVGLRRAHLVVQFGARHHAARMHGQAHAADAPGRPSVRPIALPRCRRLWTASRCQPAGRSGCDVAQQRRRRPSRVPAQQRFEPCPQPPRIDRDAPAGRRRRVRAPGSRRPRRACRRAPRSEPANHWRNCASAAGSGVVIGLRVVHHRVGHHLIGHPVDRLQAIDPDAAQATLRQAVDQTALRRALVRHHQHQVRGCRPRGDRGRCLRSGARDPRLAVITHDSHHHGQWNAAPQGPLWTPAARPLRAGRVWGIGSRSPSHPGAVRRALRLNWRR